MEGRIDRFFHIFMILTLKACYYLVLFRTPSNCGQGIVLFADAKCLLVLQALDNVYISPLKLIFLCLRGMHIVSL